MHQVSVQAQRDGAVGPDEADDTVVSADTDVAVSADDMVDLDRVAKRE